jgi:putative DNA primase/helicase
MEIDNRFRINQFTKFHKLLMANAPERYEPWFIGINKLDKCIDGRIVYSRATQTSCCGTVWKVINYKNKKGYSKKTICEKCGMARGSWKQPWAKLSLLECIELIKAGYNIGIVARKDDPLILVDIDSFKYVDELPNSLIVTSRKRCGMHGYYWKLATEEIPNIPTDDCGEVRCNDQYVLAPGSYVPTVKETIEKEFREGHIDFSKKKDILDDELLGYYTITNELSPSMIKLKDLPKFFHAQLKKEKEAIRKNKKKRIPNIKTNYPKSGSGTQTTRMFNLTFEEILDVIPGARVHHPLHDSDTCSNFCIDAEHTSLAHCWRHNTTMNVYQFLVIKSGYMTCCEAGVGHKGKSPSQVKGDKGALFNAWYTAKKLGLLPKNDPIPYNAMTYIAEKHKLPLNEKGNMKISTHNKVIELLEEGRW